MSTEMAKSLAGESGLDYEDTQLTLGLLGGTDSGSDSKPETKRKRGFSETIDLWLGGGSPRATDLTADSSEVPVSSAGKPPAAKYVGMMKNILDSNH